MSLRVLHVYSGNLYGGVESLLVTSARQRVVCPTLEPCYALCFEGRLSEELRQSGVDVAILGAVRVSRPWTVWRARAEFRRLLQRERPEVVLCHSCWPHAIFAPVARSLRLPVAFWAHDVYTGRNWIERWASWTPPDLVFVNSRFTERSVPKVFAEVPSEVLYLPVAAPPSRDRASVRRRVREALNVSSEQTVIVQACRLERWKGHTLLLDALGRLKDEPNWVCWIAGGAQRSHEQIYLAELKATVERLGLSGRVNFLGQRTDVPELYAAADLHCQPNTGPEPFGVALVEALYAGLPVVTTAMGGALEVLDETCGVLSPPDDVAALAETLRRLIRSPEARTQLGSCGPSRAAELCDPVRQLASLEASLRALPAPRATEGVIR